MMNKSGVSADNLIKKVFKDKKAFTVFSAMLLIGVFVAFGISTISNREDISRLEQQKAEISAKYEEQAKVNKELQAVLDNDNKDDYIEKKAREKGYVKSDEIVFYDISASE